MFSALLLAYPQIDPVMIHLGPLAIRWYAVAYLLGLLLGIWLVSRLNRTTEPRNLMSKQALDDLLVWAVAGVVLGGRLGYVLFYKPSYYWEHPGEILQVWHGGMAFHGGLIGVLIAMAGFARYHRIAYFSVMDLLAVATPIGLCLGRIANFINGELYGRMTDVPWAMVFPEGGPFARHPSQLYQAGMEGVLLFLILLFAATRTKARTHSGLISGLFLAGYATARMIGECFREPDAYLGFFAGGITMGQILSLPMLAAGLFLIWRARRT